MEPTLRAGDWLLVDTDEQLRRTLRVGDLVVAGDPGDRSRYVVKRVAGINPDGSLALAGDHPAHAEEPRLQTVTRSAVVGRPWFRYWPPARLGRLR
jgi:phage repressor protein C with HTH and peptisase S24 domain